MSNCAVVESSVAIPAKKKTPQAAEQSGESAAPAKEKPLLHSIANTHEWFETYFFYVMQK
jgi:hypothetical protein